MQYNDYELVAIAKEGNEEAINLIYQKYKPIIVSKSKDAIVFASHHGIEISDIMQEGYIGLDEAINSFNEDDNIVYVSYLITMNDEKLNAKSTIGMISDNEYTSSQDQSKYIVKHETVTHEGTTYDAGIRYEGKDPNNYIDFNDDGNYLGE